MEAKPKATCKRCNAERDAKPAKDGGIKVPVGWKRQSDGSLLCGKCRAELFIGRSIRLRIVGPANGEERNRKAMYAALNAASKQSNQFANWLLQKLLAADMLQLQTIRGLEVNSKGRPKLPPVPIIDWYSEGTKLFPACAPTSLVQQAQMITRFYSAERFSSLVAMAKNVRSYRWDGLPVVVNAQSWKLRAAESDGIVLTAQIGPGKSWTLKVFAEGENLQRMRQIVSGEVVPGAAMFVRRARASRPGEAKRMRVWYLRISAQVPRVEKKERQSHKEITLNLGHDAESLLFGALDEGDEVFEYPAPILRSLIAAHKKLDRQRQIDASFRREGWSKRKVRRWSVGRTAACERNNNKIKNEIALCAASLVRWCQSRGVSAIDYDVTPRGWMESFPYHALQERIKISLENSGIHLHMFGESSTGNEIEIESGLAVEVAA